MKTRLATILFAASVGLTLAAPAQAAFTYYYFGNLFTDITNSNPPPGTYDTSMSVTGSFTVNDKIMSPTLQDISALVLGYSFNDGRQTLNDGNSTIDAFDMSTDASGSPVLWRISVGVNIPLPIPTTVGDVRQQIITRNDLLVLDQGLMQVCTSVNPSGSCKSDSVDMASNQNRAGSWSVAPTAVPEPATLAPFLVGLASMAFVARRPYRTRAVKTD